MQNRIGVDLGGVLAPSHVVNWPSGQPVQGALDAIAHLLSAGWEVCVVSKIKAADTRERARVWLAEWFPDLPVSFTREKAEKKSVCGDFDLCHFVDDSLGVMRHLGGVQNKYLLKADEDFYARKRTLHNCRGPHPWVWEVCQWDDIMQIITGGRYTH